MQDPARGVVLVVTQDERVRGRLMRALEASAFETAMVHNAHSAESALHDHDVDVVVLDGRNLDGVSTRTPESIVARSPRIRVVVANASLLDPAGRRVFSQHGARLVNGIEPDLLVSTVEESLDHSVNGGKMPKEVYDELAALVGGIRLDLEALSAPLSPALAEWSRWASGFVSGLYYRKTARRSAETAAREALRSGAVRLGLLARAAAGAARAVTFAIDGDDTRTWKNATEARRIASLCRTPGSDMPRRE